MDARAWLNVAKPLTDRIAAATGLTQSTVVAVLILLVGLVAGAVFGRLARRLVARSARWIGDLQPGAMSLPHLERVQQAVGRAVYWLVVVCAVMAATETLGLPVVTAWLSGVATFLPRVAVAILIIALCDWRAKRDAIRQELADLRKDSALKYQGSGVEAKAAKAALDAAAAAVASLDPVLAELDAAAKQGSGRPGGLFEELKQEGSGR